jgi:hypothetical protein
MQRVSASLIAGVLTVPHVPKLSFPGLAFA